MPSPSLRRFLLGLAILHMPSRESGSLNGGMEAQTVATGSKHFRWNLTSFFMNIDPSTGVIAMSVAVVIVALFCYSPPPADIDNIGPGSDAA
jgi:hypothetical protein